MKTQHANGIKILQKWKWTSRREIKWWKWKRNMYWK